MSPVVTSGIAPEVEVTTPEVEVTKYSRSGTKLRIGVAAVGTTQKSVLEFLVPLP